MTGILRKDTFSVKAYSIELWIYKIFHPSRFYNVSCKCYLIYYSEVFVTDKWQVLRLLEEIRQEEIDLAQVT